MIDHEETLRRMRAADPVPRLEDIDDVEASHLFAAIEERRAVMATESARSTRPSRGPRLRPALVAAAGFVIAAVAIGAAAMLMRTGEGTGGDVATDPAALPPTTVPEPATTVPATTAPATSAPATTAPTTTVAATTTTTPAPFARVVPLDPGAIEKDFGYPSLGFDSEGHLQVIYWRTESTVGLASCEDDECTAASIRDVFEVEGVAALYGTPRAEAGPVFWIGGGGDFGPQPRLVDCPDRDCREPAVFEMPESFGAPPAITTDSSGRTLVVSPDGGDSVGVGIWVLYCAGPSCTGREAPETVWEFPADLWIGPGWNAALRGGLPLIASRTNEGVLIAACDRPDCLPPPEGRGLDVIADIPIGGAVRGPGLALGSEGQPITLVWIEKPPRDSNVLAMMVVACVDSECTDWTITELAEVDDMYTNFSMATGPDGRVRIAWTDHDSVFLATCLDGVCSESSIVDTGHPADDIGLAFDAAGAPVIATMSRERGLELVFCGDDSCDIGS